MARNDGVDRTSVRNRCVDDSEIESTQCHNERENGDGIYSNEDVVVSRKNMNVHFKAPDASYGEMFSRMEQEGIISTRGLKKDATHYDEMILDVNSAYFHNHGGYEYAKKYYEEAYRFVVDYVGGEQYILSAVMHADERSSGMSEIVGEDVWHYHLHVVYVPVVEKEILWTKRCKDPALVGTVKERIMQVSHSKKWISYPVLDENGKALRRKDGKPVLKTSYSIVQDKYYEHMKNHGYDDIERGEPGSTEEHLSVTEYKVLKEKERLQVTLLEQKAAETEMDRLTQEKESIVKEAEEAEQKAERLKTRAVKAEQYAKKLGDAETILEDTTLLESAKSYREKKALPLVRHLVTVIKSLYYKLLEEREENRKERQAHQHDVAIWKDRAQISESVNQKAQKYDRLVRNLGNDEMERLLRTPFEKVKPVYKDEMAV